MCVCTHIDALYTYMILYDHILYDHICTIRLIIICVQSVLWINISASTKKVRGALGSSDSWTKKTNQTSQLVMTNIAMENG